MERIIDYEGTRITIGTRDLATITAEEVLQVVIINGCCPYLEYWDIPEIKDFDNTMFSDTVVLDHQSKRKEDGSKGSVFIFFFNHKSFEYHYHREHFNDRSAGNRSMLWLWI